MDDPRLPIELTLFMAFEHDSEKELPILPRELVLTLRIIVSERFFLHRPTLAVKAVAPSHERL